VEADHVVGVELSVECCTVLAPLEGGTELPSGSALPSPSQERLESTSPGHRQSLSPQHALLLIRLQRVI